jgi:hypothetical protein
MEIDKFIIRRTYTTLHSTYIAYDFLEECFELSFDFTLAFVFCLLGCFFGFSFNNNSSSVFLNLGLVCVVILCEDFLGLRKDFAFATITLKLKKH